MPQTAVLQLKPCGTPLPPKEPVSSGRIRIVSQFAGAECPLSAWAMTKQVDGNTGGFTDAECDDTIELELSAEQTLALSRADAAIPLNPLAVPSAQKSLLNVPEDRGGAWRSVILPIAAISVLSGGIAYLGTTPAQPVHVGGNAVVGSAAPETTAPPSADNAPVRFTNPFDATEVFQFPSGTSDTEARLAVADLLLQRAHDRQNASSKIARQRSKTAGQVAPVRTTSLAKRS
jgi:hypothetical protein